MKKRFLITFILFLSMQFLHAQGAIPKNLPTYDKTKIHFGFSLGSSETHLSIHKNSAFALQDTLQQIGVIPQKGFDLHIISNLRLGDYFDLRFLPGLSFGQRTLAYSFKEGISGELISELREIQSTYLEFPFDIKYKSARINNYRLYMLGGVKYVYDLESQQDSDDPKFIKLTKNDIQANAGFGVDLYLDYFKFSIELKGSWGFKDVLHNKDILHTQYIDKINVQKFMISLHFE